VFVLRTAREVAAARLGQPAGLVTPETKLGPEAPAALARLYAVAADEMVKEQVIGHSSEAACCEPRAEQLAGDDVASVADAVTRAAVRLIVGSRLDVAASELEPGLNFALDLGADSLTRVDLVLLLEEALSVSVPDDSMFLVQTVGDAELFAVLFDRTREGVVIALGEQARDLTFDTPLHRYGEAAPRLALDAASRTLGEGIKLPDCTCQTLKDAVRLAFLAAKIRQALAKATGAEPAGITDETVPERDLGLDAARTRAILAELASSMDLGVGAVEGGHARPLIDTLRLLVQATSEASR
jgi:acyl carrier protein